MLSCSYWVVSKKVRYRLPLFSLQYENGKKQAKHKHEILKAIKKTGLSMASFEDGHRSSLLVLTGLALSNCVSYPNIKRGENQRMNKR